MLRTYASFSLPAREPRFAIYDAVNEEMRAFARSTGVTLVDVQPRFEELLAGNVPRSRYFLSERDGHPNASGYEEIALLVAQAFEAG